MLPWRLDSCLSQFDTNMLAVRLGREQAFCKRPISDISNLSADGLRYIGDFPVTAIGDDAVILGDLSQASSQA